MLALLLLRMTIVRAHPESDRAQLVWAHHPSVLTTTSMREVGLAAAAGTPPSSATLKKIGELAREAPLAVQPFLVEGALADKRGEVDRAGLLYREARRRDPRSLAAHYLLTDLDLRTGQTENGIRELAELSRLVPAATDQLAPAIAKFAHGPGAADQLRNMFRSNPQLEPPVLWVLAQDPSNAGLILSVASTGESKSTRPPAWQERLLNAMVSQGQYSQAHATWSRISGSSGSVAAGLFNPSFRQVSAPPPFNWSYGATEAGVAEAEKGNLGILFYGRENTVLAQETLILAPGRYRLAMPVTVNSGDPHSLAWSITCLPGKTKLLNLPLAQKSGSGIVAGDLEVPAQDCGAQQIELDGMTEDSPTTVDLRIGPLTLQRTSG